VGRSYYQVLGVAPDAPDEEIEKAFRAAARRVHPDLHGGDGAAEERMKELNLIRATLTDPARRAEYDRRLRLERADAAPRPPAPAPPRPEAWAPTRGAAWMDVNARDARAPAAFTGEPRRRRGLRALLARLPGRGIARERPTFGALVDVGFLLLCSLFGFEVLRLVLALRTAMPKS
jgi:curved DNA-binding protein CbpA